MQKKLTDAFVNQKAIWPGEYYDELLPAFGLRVGKRGRNREAVESPRPRHPPSA